MLVGMKGGPGGVVGGEMEKGGGRGGKSGPDGRFQLIPHHPLPANPNPELPTYSNTGYWIWLKYDL